MSDWRDGIARDSHAPQRFLWMRQGMLSDPPSRHPVSLV
jgi:hypothetical protein